MELFIFIKILTTFIQFLELHYDYQEKMVADTVPIIKTEGEFILSLSHISNDR